MTPSIAIRGRSGMIWDLRDVRKYRVIRKEEYSDQNNAGVNHDGWQLDSTVDLTGPADGARN